ncbi:MAG: putative iron-sulfur cluster-binding metallochaperone [Gammaproteobacteria bacterium]
MNNQAETTEPNRHDCPANGKSYPPVKSSTLKHNLVNPWRVNIDSRQFYCCDDPDCDVIYFDEKDHTIAITELRDTVGLKTGIPEDLLCFCFGVSLNDARSEFIKTFVKDQTKSGACACQTRNPFGRCCLKDFPQ